MIGMGQDLERTARETWDREMVFRFLALIGWHLRGVREREPLADDRADTC